MASWLIREALPEDRHEIAAMRHLLWPDSSAEEHLRELELELPAMNFVALDERESLIGFSESGSRS